MNKIQLESSDQVTEIVATPFCRLHSPGACKNYSGIIHSNVREGESY